MKETYVLGHCVDFVEVLALELNERNIRNKRDVKQEIDKRKIWQKEDIYYKVFWCNAWGHSSNCFKMLEFACTIVSS